MPVKRISSDKIEMGMYISSLDRPWSETPFLFQGFEVSSIDELNDLQRLTRHVYIMLPDEEIELLSIPSADADRVPHLGILGQVEYEITSSAEEELESIQDEHERLASLISDVENMAEQDQELQIDQLDNSMSVLVKSMTSNPDAFIWLTQIKEFDSYVYKDALSCSVWGTSLGRQLGISEENLQMLATGLLVMDLGKTALPRNLIHKSTRLNLDEWDVMKTHVSHSLDLLEQTNDVPVQILDLVRTHHERLDGSGYPEGLHGNQIPLFGQVAGIVDFYVSVTNPRPFAPAIAPSVALDMLYHQQGHFFDEMLVQNFIQVLSTYPTGSLVELSTGEVGIVASQNPGLKLKPKIILLLDSGKQPYGNNPILNLMNETVDDQGNPLSIVKTLADGSHGIRIDQIKF